MLRLIGTIATLKVGTRPSEIMGLESDSWLAFCFDEACAFILTQLKNDKKPIMKVEEDKIKYSRPSDLYNKYQ